MTFKPQPLIDYEYVARKTIVCPWEEWFAWYPVAIHNKRVWLKKVYRRKITYYVDMEEWSTYAYSTVFDLLTD